MHIKRSLLNDGNIDSNIVQGIKQPLCCAVIRKFGFMALPGLVIMQSEVSYKYLKSTERCMVQPKITHFLTPLPVLPVNLDG